MTERVQVSGLRELRAHLRAMDRRLPKLLSKAGKAAAWMVAREARPMVPRGPQAGGHAAMSIKPSATQKGAQVAEGGNRYPYMAWLDFGGSIHPREHQTIHRSYIRRGRFIWAAFARRKQEVMDLYLEELDRQLRDAGLDVE